jgi:SNF2 family DNA or RNA helicase
MYLLEAATNPALLPAGSASADPLLFHHPPLDIPAGSRLADLIAEYGQYETPRKFIELAQIVRANAEQGRKTLVWSNFVRNLEQLAYRVLPGMQPALIHGGVPMEESATGFATTRAQELYRFRNDPNCAVLLANPAALGEGVSLHQVCNDAIYIDRTFNAGQYLQSLDRIHRLGLAPDQETRITLLLTAGTVDEVVDVQVSGKADRLATVLNDASLTTFALPDEDDYGPALDMVEDLMALFAHLRGEDPSRRAPEG